MTPEPRRSDQDRQFSPGYAQALLRAWGATRVWSSIRKSDRLRPTITGTVSTPHAPSVRWAVPRNVWRRLRIRSGFEAMNRLWAGDPHRPAMLWPLGDEDPSSSPPGMPTVFTCSQVPEISCMRVTRRRRDGDAHSLTGVTNSSEGSICRIGPSTSMPAIPAR